MLFQTNRCFDNHVFHDRSATSTDRLIIDDKGKHHCLAAGSLSANTVDSVLSSIVNAFPQTSFLQQTNSLGVVTGLPPAPTENETITLGLESLTSEPATVTPIPATTSAPGSEVLTLAPGTTVSGVVEPTSSVTITRSGSNAIPTPSAVFGTTNLISISTLTSPSTPNSSGTSSGLIAGAVIGSIAVLILAGILTMLVIRHKKKANATSKVEDRVESGAEKRFTTVDRRCINRWGTRWRQMRMCGRWRVMDGRRRGS
ncbi:hypothetical protein EJ02DRAFT_495507 [Clathrospora elynae]|uniref:Uncharacterized protein n=1 Tax=Clathrospora elynae TaxID=706981 RepID=A0A6A5ST57_9PLEO|nr:hypothetical protein EJ02DRAFT_495507 [Clathrospora elynae]